MRNLTLTPHNRSFFGFDNRAQQHAAQMACAPQQAKQPSYPPYNIELLAEDKYNITMAVAGFDSDEIEIESQQNELVVKGTKAKPDKEAEPVKDKQYLYQGIAERNFERKFQLGDHVKVIDATITNGLLQIDLAREVPEALKPRKIAINAGGSALPN